MIGVILAGGESKRFGANKGFACYQGKPFYEHSIKAVAECVHQTILVTNPTLYSIYKEKINIQVMKDVFEYQGCGPLAGLYTAMQTVEADWYMILPVDVPLMDQKIIHRLMQFADNKFEAVIPEINGKKQPLIALYHQSIQSKVYDQLVNNDLKMMNLLSILSAKYVSEDQIGERSHFHNINTVKDYETYVKS